MACTTTTDTIEPQRLDRTYCEASMVIEPLFWRGSCEKIPGLGKGGPRKAVSRTGAWECGRQSGVADLQSLDMAWRKSLESFCTARTLKVFRPRQRRYRHQKCFRPCFCSIIEGPYYIGWQYQPFLNPCPLVGLQKTKQRLMIQPQD